MRSAIADRLEQVQEERRHLLLGDGIEDAVQADADLALARPGIDDTIGIKRAGIWGTFDHG